MLNIGDFLIIRELFQTGWTKLAIPEATRFDRKTVSKYIKDNNLSKRKGNKQKTRK